MNALFKLLNNRIKAKQSSSDQMLLNTFFAEHYYPHALLTKRRPHYDLHIYNKHIRDSLGSKSFKALTHAVLDQWVREHIVKQYKPGTINKHIFLVNRLINLAKHWGIEPPPVCRRLQSKYGWSLWKKVTEPTDFQLRYAPARFG